MKAFLHRILVLILSLTLCLGMVPEVFAENPGTINSVIIPKGLLTIEDESFMNCTSITSVTIPVSLTRIGNKAFYGCNGLKDVYYDGTEEQWDNIVLGTGNGPLTRATIHCAGDADDYYIELTYSNVFNPKEWNYKAAAKFAQMVQERTDGHVVIDFHGLNELDCYRDSILHAVNGENWIGLEEPSLFADWVGDCAILVGPMLYNNDEEYNYVMDSDLVMSIKNALAEQNIHILDTHYSFGFRSFCTNLNITNPADLNGVKIRSTTASLFIKTIQCMGATPVPMSFTECMSAISSGIIDGFEGSTSTLAGAGAPYNVVKNVALTKHLISTRWLFMAENVYQSMPIKWRSILEQCALECGVWEQTNCSADEEVLIKRLNDEAGVVYNDVDLDAFTSACTPVFDWITNEYQADPFLHTQIIELIRSYRGKTEPIHIHTHSFTEWVETAVKTCIQDGKYYRTCTECGYVQNKTVKASGHEFTEWAEASRSDTHIYFTRTCKNCGENEQKFEPIPVDGQITLVYAEVNPLNGTVSGEMAKAFKLKAEELSGCQITIDIRASGVLGSEDLVLDNMLGGGSICDLCRISPFALTAYGCNQTKILSMPYVFANAAHFQNFADSDLAQELLLEPKQIGLPLRGLCYGLESFRHFFFSDATGGIEDLNGRRIRVSTDPIMLGMVSDLNASPVPMPFSEALSALQSGIINGAEQSVSRYSSYRFYSAAPYLLLDGHTADINQIIISDKGWEKLSEQQQNWIIEAAAYASQVCTNKAVEAEQYACSQLASDGVTIVNITDKAPWREACQPTISANVGNYASLYQFILDLQ